MFEGSAVQPDSSVSDTCCNGVSPACHGDVSALAERVADSSGDSKVVDVENVPKMTTNTELDATRRSEIQSEVSGLTNEQAIQELSRKIEVSCRN